MAAQTWTALQTTFLAVTVKAQPPYGIPPPDFAALLPQATSYAEQRIFTDIPFLGHRASNTSLATTPGSRTINLGAMVQMGGGPIIVPEALYLITPAGTTTPGQGQRVPFLKSSDFVINMIWPNESVVAVPSILSPFVPNYWALVDYQTIIYAPTADNAYTAQIDGLFQPTPIGPGNPTTYISNTYPAMLEAACMVFLTGALLHNYGAQADDPRQGVSWEMLYTQLMESAKAEEIRRRGLAPDLPMPTQQGAAR